MSTNPHSIARQSAWSHYWKQGALHALPGSLDNNYSGPVEAFWKKSLEALGAQHRVLDIGTGNGALPQLICHDCLAGMPQVDAIDLADIFPAWVETQPAACRHALRFHSCTSAESLPFSDDTFDLVISQYGLEYSTWKLALPEVARTLAPGGRISLLMHHRDSRLTEVAREEERHVDWLFQIPGFFDALESVIPWFAMAASEVGRMRLRDDQQANLDRTIFNRAMQALAERARTSLFPDLLEDARNFAAQSLAALQQQPAEEVLTHCGEYRVVLLEAKLRYTELCACALDEPRMQAFSHQLTAAGLSNVAHNPIHHENGMLLGWTLTADKPAG